MGTSALPDWVKGQDERASAPLTLQTVCAGYPVSEAAAASEIQNYGVAGNGVSNMSEIDITKMSEQQFVAFVNRSIKKDNNPLCPYCQQPLVIVQEIEEYIYWTWDEGKKIYVEDGGSNTDLDQPYCNHCLTKDDDFNSILSAFEE